MLVSQGVGVDDVVLGLRHFLDFALDLDRAFGRNKFGFCPTWHPRAQGVAVHFVALIDQTHVEMQFLRAVLPGQLGADHGLRTLDAVHKGADSLNHALVY